MKSTDDECKTFVQNTLHTGLEQLDAPMGQEKKACHDSFGACRKSAGLEACGRLVQRFHQALVSHSVKVGALLRINGLGSSCLCFLGICLQRPHVHVMLHATVGSAGASARDCSLKRAADGNPVISTSLQLFQSFVEEDREGRPLEILQVEVCRYKVEFHPHREPCVAVVMNHGGPAGANQVFMVDANASLSVRKPRTRLPFGLKLPKRIHKNQKPKADPATGSRKPRKRKASRETDAESRRKREKVNQSESDPGRQAERQQPGAPNAGDSDDDRTIRNLFLGGEGETHSDGKDGSGSDASSARKLESPDPGSDTAEPASSSQGFGVGSGALPSSSGGEHMDARKDLEREEHEVIPISTEAMQEEAAAASLIVEQDVEKNQLAHSALPAQSVVPPGTSGGSFFSSELGLTDVAKAVSGRSTCFFCRQQIAKGSLRMCWFSKRQRPSNWVHDACVISLALRDGMLEQVVSKLNELLGQTMAKLTEQPNNASQREVKVALERCLSEADAKHGHTS